MEALEGLSRRTLYTHAPGTLTYQVRIPEAGQLDVGLRVVGRDAPVTFRVTVTPSGGEAGTRLEETVAETEQWAQRRIDLSDLSQQAVSLALEADADRAGSVALWAAPTLSGARTTEKPNIIFYVIDGAGADFMSLYGYNRRTTPNLERIAAEGAVFDYAYSNSTWTGPSTLSFLTSLQHSVLGGLRNGRNMVPEGVLTLAEHLHRAGYQTAEVASNPNAGTFSGLDERGNDWFHDIQARPQATSSVELHEDFWRWREAYPAEPYFVHFQTTDVHGPFNTVVPFAGLFVGPELRESRRVWVGQLGRFPEAYSDAFEKTGISRIAYFNASRGLYDESMAHPGLSNRAPGRTSQGPRRVGGDAADRRLGSWRRRRRQRPEPRRGGFVAAQVGPLLQELDQQGPTDPRVARPHCGRAARQRAGLHDRCIAHRPGAGRLAAAGGHPRRVPSASPAGRGRLGVPPGDPRRVLRCPGHRRAHRPDRSDRWPVGSFAGDQPAPGG